MRHSPLLALVFAIFTVTSQVRAQEYKINLKANGEDIAFIDLSIRGNTAITKVGDMTERFDLKNLRWQHDESKQWVSLEHCETWAKQSKEKTKKSTVSVPDQIRPFVLWSLAPTFEIAATDTILTLTSGQVNYKIVVEKADQDLLGYFRYARLNAYKKAMTEGKLPPFAELLVIDELERRKLMPRSIEIQIPGIPGAPTIKMLIANKKQ